MVELNRFPFGSFAGLAGDDVGRTDERPPLVLIHGLTFDRRTWWPALTELDTIDPGRRAIALDLPGHGDSPDEISYAMQSLVERIHEAIVAAHLEDPVVIGHSLGAGAATMYAAQYPTAGVVSVEGSLRIGDFARMAQSLEPVLRSPGFDAAWGRITDNVFRLGEVSAEIRDVVHATSQARQDVVLGYWQDLFERTPADLDAWTARGSAALRLSGVSYVGVFGQDPSSEDAAWMRTNLPDARLIVWPHSGHFPHVAHPRRFAQLLAETATWGRQPVVAQATL